MNKYPFLELDNFKAGMVSTVLSIVENGGTANVPDDIMIFAIRSDKRILQLVNLA